MICGHPQALARIRERLIAQTRDVALMLPAGQSQPVCLVEVCDCGASVGKWRGLRGARLPPAEPGGVPKVCVRCVPPELLAGLNVSHGYCQPCAAIERGMLLPRLVRR